MPTPPNDFTPKPEAAALVSASLQRARSSTERWRSRAVSRGAAVRFTLAVLALGWGCGEGTAPPAPVATVAISPNPPIELVVGGSHMLSAVPKDAQGSTLTERITTWSTSDATKVTVDVGLVRGVAIGSATITATVEGKTANVDVQVKDGAVVTAAGTSFSAQSGAVAVVVPAGAVTQPINFIVEAAPSVPANPRLLPGTAFVVGPGAATFAQGVSVTIRYNPAHVASDSPEGGLQLYEVVGTSWRVVTGSTVNTTAKTVSGNVLHSGIYGVLMQPRVETVTVGGELTPIPVVTTRQFTATIRDIEGTTLTRPVSWSSSNPAILTIDPTTGLASAKTPGSVTITATSEGKSGTATISVVPGPPSKLVANTGNNQSVAAGAAVATPPSVKVTDAGDNPIANVAVTFAVASGGGTITGASATTNAAGIATVGSWTLGAVAGPNTLTATSPAISGASVTFQAAGGAGPAARIAAFAGNGQTATAGGLIATPPSVKVTDANGNFVTGFTVTFAPAGGSGSVTGASAVTDASGVATVGSWRLGPTPGPQSLTASGIGLTGSPITFSATAVAPVPTTIAGFAGNNQTTRAGSAVATPPSVIVTDPAGIPVPGVTVTFAVTSGGGSVTGATAVTNSEGIAAVGGWTLGTAAGPNTMTATVAGLSGSPVTFAANGVTLPPAAIAIHAGDNQSALAGQPVPIRPAVRVTDAEGQPVAGASVTFSIRSGGGTVSGASVLTDAAGIATVGNWVLGSGGNSLFASVTGVATEVIFVALGQAQVQLVTFGDSNTDLGFEGTSPSPRVSSYVSSSTAGIRLAAGAPNSILQVAGKVEARWRANRQQTIKVVNHGISQTLTGAGRTIVFAPNALEVVNGVTRFQGEVLGIGYPWSGGEPVNDFYPQGAILRVNAFRPRTTDFAYISIGTNDILNNVSPTIVRNNIEIMIDQWIAAGLPANRLIVTTLPPIGSAGSAAMQTLNSMIRTLAQQKGVRIIDVAAFTSADGIRWTSPALHVGDFLHYSEQIRDRIADEITSIMLQMTPP